MAQLAIVNAPSSFTTIWSFIKPWLAKETAAKVDILGSDYQTVLLNLIDKENLPTSLGGACQCEGGCEHSNAGPWSEGRAERRAKFLKGEGEAGVHVSPEVLNGGVRGTLEEDAEERATQEKQHLEPPKASNGGLLSALSRSGSSKSGSSKKSSVRSQPIDIPERKSREHERDGDASSQSTKASSPGPSTPPLDVTSDFNGLHISSSESVQSNDRNGSDEKGLVAQRDDVTPTTPKEPLSAMVPSAPLPGPVA